MTLREVMARGDPEFPGGEAERRGWYAGYDAAVAEARASADPTSVAGERIVDLDGHIADEVRDACLAVLGRVVSFDHSRQIADRIIVKIAALATTAPDAAKREGRT
ncbi:MAG TPA: hypothetical protein VF638_14185 [Sphingomonas sp.]|jgi:hypothetical protein